MDPHSSHQPERARLTLRLHGGASEAGKIPLDDIARIAQDTQELIRRLARGISGRGGPGRTPKDLERLTDLLLVGLHEGSTVIEIEAPAAQAEFELPDVQPDIGVQAIDALMKGLDAAINRQPLPHTFSEPALAGLRQWFVSLGNYSEVALDAQTKGHRTVTFVPANARESLFEGPLELEEPLILDERAIEGVLYAVNLHSHTYSIEDDAGRSIRCTLSEEPENIGQLLGHRVRAEGVSSVDDEGRIEHFDVRLVRLAETPSQLNRDRFFRKVDVEQLIAENVPVSQLASLEIEGLTEDESAAFLSALSDGYG